MRAQCSYWSRDHCIMGVHAKRIGCRDDEGEETVLHLLETRPALCQMIKIHLGAYYIDDLSDLSNIDVGSLSLFIVSFRRFRD